MSTASDPSSTPPRRKGNALAPLAWGVGMGLVGFAANLAPIELAPGVHFLLGLLPVMIAAVCGGGWSGAIAGAISALPTLSLWGHPLALFGAVFEGAAVGALRNRLRPVVADALYWIAGSVYVLVSYKAVINLGVATILPVGFKQILNGISAALVVQVLLVLPPVRRRMRQWVPAPLRDVPVRTAFGAPVMLGALLPLLVLGGTEGRARYAQARQNIEDANRYASRVIAARLEQALGADFRAADVLSRELAAEIAAGGQLPARDALQRRLEAMVEASPELLNAYVSDERGRVWAFWPPTAPDGRPLAGYDFSDRPYVARARATREPFVTGIFQGRGGADRPIVVGVAPIHVEDRFFGYTLVAYRPAALASRALQALRPDQRALVLDASANVVIDSDAPDASSVRSEVGSPLTAALEALGTKTSGVYVAPGTGPTLNRVRSTRYFSTAAVPSVGWRVVVEQPPPQLERDVNGAYARLLGALLVALGLVALAVTALGSIVVAPVRQVADAARRLAAGERHVRTGQAASEAPREVRQLSAHFDHMADELAGHLEALERAAQEKDAFLSVASHELKTPLTSLKAQVQLLRRRLSADPDASGRLDTAVRQVDRVTRLVNGMLDASQLAGGQLALVPAPMDLAEVAARVAESLVSASPAHRLELNLARALGEWDELRLEQIVFNLVSNAIKYSPQGGPVEVTVRALADGGSELLVADRGIGVEPARKDLFERFSRGEAGVRAGISGFGVGLYVSREIAMRHGGELSVTPREGGGSVARLRLPPRIPGAAATPTPAQAAAF